MPISHMLFAKLGKQGNRGNQRKITIELEESLLNNDDNYVIIVNLVIIWYQVILHETK